MKKETIEKIFKEGICLNGYILLSMIKNGEDFLPLLGIRRVEGLMNVIQRKSFVDKDFKLTDKGNKLLEDIGVEKIPILGIDDTQNREEKVSVPEKNSVFEEWTSGLLGKLQNKLKEITGKKQVMGFGHVYFLPGIQDLRTFLLRFNKTYKMSLQNNKEKIETILLKHVTKCAKTKNFSPAVKYFIIKDGAGSQLASALEAYEDVQDNNMRMEKIEVRNTKDLF